MSTATVQLDELRDLPGFDLVRQGLEDLRGRRPTPAAWLCQIARPRLREAGLWPEDLQPLPGEAELELYRLLRHQEPDAYARYNALLRELVSFEQCLDHRLRRRLETTRTQRP